MPLLYGYLMDALKEAKEAPPTPQMDAVIAKIEEAVLLFEQSLRQPEKK